ncbi:putative apses transcription factor [Rhizodiscina lignyota]|uniref:Apses transcription factor n=1 Tax=Rhizodiscina lignyota TaxID=1504668 RepID=A0A9P4IL54_9PEZI|nr:putative apses transcription factor [Rhizodiscina lignyota]
MVKRHIPERHNPLLEPEHTPQLEILVERRRLGSTDLSVKPGEEGMSPPAKAESLGVFDYAHLRVPLPKDLKGSGIFRPADNKYPESYFLMRRSSDGFISATGMFKAAFPWASLQEEQVERKHHKELPSVGPEEVAGNVWISPEVALKLADEYNMRSWIIALLDPEPIEKGTRDKDKSSIQTPPKYVLPKKYALAPTEGTNSVRGSRRRELRSASPSKIATPSRKIASPRKRAAKKTATEDTPAAEASKELNKIIENGENGTAPSTEPESKTESIDMEDKVRVEVDETVERTDDVETTHTTVRIEMPAGSPELPLPDNAEDMIAQAREMVEKAREEEGRPTSSKGKRKADVLEEEEEDADEAGPVQPAKKVKMMEQQLKRQKVRNRAMVGVIAVFAVGSMIPYFL